VWLRRHQRDELLLTKVSVEDWRVWRTGGAGEMKGDRKPADGGVVLMSEEGELRARRWWPTDLPGAGSRRFVDNSYQPQPPPRAPSLPGIPWRIGQSPEAEPWRPRESDPQPCD